MMFRNSLSSLFSPLRHRIHEKNRVFIKLLDAYNIEKQKKKKYCKIA